MLKINALGLRPARLARPPHLLGWRAGLARMAGEVGGKIKQASGRWLLVPGFWSRLDCLRLELRPKVARRGLAAGVGSSLRCV